MNGGIHTHFLCIHLVCTFAFSYLHRMVELLVLAETSGNSLVQSQCSREGLARADYLWQCSVSFEYLQGQRSCNLFFRSTLITEEQRELSVDYE